MFRVVKTSSLSNLNYLKYNSKIILKQQSAHKTNNLMNNGLSVKFFSRNFFSNMGTSIIKYCIGGSLLIYIIGLPLHQGEYVRRFLFNKRSFQEGNLISLVSCHFAKTGVIDLVLDCVIIGLLGMNIRMMAGEEVLRKLIIYSVVFSCGGLFLMNDSQYFIKSDSIIRSMLYYYVMMNPHQKFYLIPFPFEVKALYLGIFLAALDIMQKKICNFGGALAAHLVTRGLI